MADFLSFLDWEYNIDKNDDYLEENRSQLEMKSNKGGLTGGVLVPPSSKTQRELTM